MWFRYIFFLFFTPTPNLFVAFKLFCFVSKAKSAIFFFDVGILYIDKGGFEPTIQPKPALSLQQSSVFLVLEF